jgi:hypothetical protein
LQCRFRAADAEIQGVRVKLDNGTEQTIFADLVLDASGRGSSSPAWLESLGYARPQEERVGIGIGYTTRVYRRRPTDLSGKLAVVVAGSGPTLRNGTILFQAKDRVSFGGYFGDHAPDDAQLFAAYVGSLVFGDALCSFNPVCGQGMTVAAQEASLLRKCLRDGAADLARRLSPCNPSSCPRR